MKKKSLIIIALFLLCSFGRSYGLTPTPVQSWSKPHFQNFHKAAACSFNENYYGIFAVFTISDGSDELWFLKINGDSTSADYGQVVYSMFMANEDTIHHVDCAEDGDGSIFITWDRSDDTDGSQNARWCRVDVDGSRSVFYEVPHCPYESPTNDYRSFATGIAYSNDHERIAVSSSGRDSCDICWSLFDREGNLLHHVYPSLFGGDAVATDIEWNGNNAFIMAILYILDGGEPTVHTFPINPLDGTYLFGAVEIYRGYGGEVPVYPGDEIDKYENIELVRTGNTVNDQNLLVVRTARWTIWLNEDGTKYDDGTNPRIAFFKSYHATCEYWGNGTAIAQSYLGTFLPPVFRTLPFGFYFSRPHWTPEPGAINYSPSRWSNYWPASCSSAYVKPEVLVAGGRLINPFNIFDSDENIYFHIESEYVFRFIMKVPPRQWIIPPGLIKLPPGKIKPPPGK